MTHYFFATGPLNPPPTPPTPPSAPLTRRDMEKQRLKERRQKATGKYTERFQADPDGVRPLPSQILAKTGLIDWY